MSPVVRGKASDSRAHASATCTSSGWACFTYSWSSLSRSASTKWSRANTHHVLGGCRISTADQSFQVLSQLGKRLAHGPHSCLKACPVYFCLLVVAKPLLKCSHHTSVGCSLYWG
ncbi:hypothetical protein E2C01_088184 [Portunus trituberculatus]|uniref:Uncharacterized protein n=1 Tax=Portunus trituberculatus TaxID=210409 RepID=A0A5B7JJ75_PORTR|nr:hypothetical protein [Portunus trituberculatus]